jgi:hypothetical protein
MALQVMKSCIQGLSNHILFFLLCSDHDAQKVYDEDCVLTSVADHVILLGKNLETLCCCWVLSDPSLRARSWYELEELLLAAELFIQVAPTMCIAPLLPEYEKLSRPYSCSLAISSPLSSNVISHLIHKYEDDSSKKSNATDVPTDISFSISHSTRSKWYCVRLLHCHSISSLARYGMKSFKIPASKPTSWSDLH